MQRGEYSLYTGWSNYRLGDFFLRQSFFRNRPNGAQWYFREHPDSLVGQYLHATTEDGDYELMAGLIRDSPIREANTPDPDAVVVHLRVGDIFENSPGALRFMHPKERMPKHWDIPAFFEGHLGAEPGWEKALQHYIMPRASYEDILPDLRAKGVSSVTLVAGSHYRYDSYPRSSQYIDLVSDWFYSKGFDVDYRFGRPPDDDVIYMAQARVFVQSGGGFSSVISRLCHTLGGTPICSDRHFSCDPDLRPGIEWANDG